LCISKGLTDRITLIRKSQAQNTIIDRIKNTDVLLLPSIKEGIANVVLEAMALGTLVISSNCGGMNEVIQPGENGFLVPPRDFISICDKVIDLKSMDVGRINLIRERARQTIATEHKLSVQMDRMDSFYQKVLKTVSVK